MQWIQQMVIACVIGLILMAGWKRMTRFLPTGVRSTWAWYPKTRWQVVMVFLSIVGICGFLPEITGTLRWFGRFAIAGVDKTFYGTPRSKWGIGSPEVTVRVLPPLGVPLNRKDPIAWSEGARAKIREAIQYERMNESGACFVGILPPDGWANFRFSSRELNSLGQWKAVAMSLTDEGFLTPFELEIATEGNEVPTNALNLPELSKNGVEERRLSNVGRGHDVAECYVQCVGKSPPEVFKVDTFEIPTGTFQYEVEVGVNETSFTLPYEGWTYAWVSPVYQENYQAVWEEGIIPPTGTKTEHYKGLLAIQLLVNGKKTTLGASQVFQPQNLKDDKRLSLSLKLPSDDPGLEEKEAFGSLLKKPAKVIVGIQLR